MRRATSEPRWGRKSIGIFLSGAISFLFHLFCCQFIFFFISFVGNIPSCLALLLAMNCLIYLLRWQTNSFLFVLSAICYLFYIDITYRGQPERIVLKPFSTNYTYNLYFTIYPLWQVCCFRAAISCLRVYTSCLLSEVNSSSAFRYRATP